MARRNSGPEGNERRAKIREMLQASNISSMEDIQNLFKETIAEFMENGLNAELDDELGYSKYDYKNKKTDNSRNGHSSKTLRTSFGDVVVSVPRDRKGEYEPQLLKKNQTSISQDIEEKILSMYAKGMTTSDIESHIRDIYGIEVSDTTVSRVTDKILPVAKEWQQRPLESVYAVVFLDAIHFHVRSEGQIVKKAVYIAIGIKQLRKVTKAKSVFPTDDSLLKMLYLAMMDITRKWTGRRQDWSMIHAQLAVYFDDRMPN